MVRAASGAGRFELSYLAVGVGMGDDTSGKSDPDHRQSDEAALSARLRHLGDQLDRHRPSPPPQSVPGPAADSSALARGFRLSSELVELAATVGQYQYISAINTPFDLQPAADADQLPIEART